MTRSYNADEVFEIALELERAAAAFYRFAAERAREPTVRELLSNLATWEASHERVIGRVRGQLREEGKLGSYDPADEAGRYLRAVADQHALRTGKYAGGRLRGEETISEILAVGLAFEKDAVLFYTGLRETTPADWGRDWIDRIIEEERRHVAYLADELEKHAHPA